MTTTRGELARDIFLADNVNAPSGLMEAEWDGNKGDETYAHSIADGLIAKGYTKPRKVETFDELEALADGTAVLDYEHDVSTKHNGKWHGYEMNPLDSRKFKNYGPFTVLWEPAVSA